MARETEAPAVLVLRNAADTYIVARRGDDSDRLRWPSYKVSRHGIFGPNLFGNFTRFSPSDYAEAEGPYPAPVQQAIDRLTASA